MACFLNICNSSSYTSRYDTDDVVHHIYKLIEMCAVGK